MPSKFPSRIKYTFTVLLSWFINNIIVLSEIVLSNFKFYSNLDPSIAQFSVIDYHYTRLSQTNLYIQEV